MNLLDTIKLPNSFSLNFISGFIETNSVGENFTIFLFELSDES